MLEIDRRKIVDELNKQENEFLDEWNKLPAIYDLTNTADVRKYENIAGAINHIEKCKYLIANPPI